LGVADGQSQRYSGAFDVSQQRSRALPENQVSV
jgi:hypothetical protein